MAIVFRDDIKDYLTSELTKRTDSNGYVTLIDEFRIGGTKVRKELVSNLFCELVDEYFDNKVLK